MDPEGRAMGRDERSEKRRPDGGGKGDWSVRIEYLTFSEFMETAPNSAKPDAGTLGCWAAKRLYTL